MSWINTNLINVLYGLKSLNVAIPNVHELLSEPRRALNGASVCLTARFPFMGMVVGIVLGAALCAFALTPDWRLICLFCAITVVMSLVYYWRPGHRILLTLRGVEFIHPKMTVICPWELFNVKGTPLCYAAAGNMALPVNRDVLPFIRATMHGVAIAEGSRIRNRQMRFSNNSQIVVNGQYGVDPDALGSLILHLGRTIGIPHQKRAALPATLPATHAPIRKSARVDVTRIGALNRCCGCLQPTDERHMFTATSMLAHIVGGKAISVGLPICTACWRRVKRARWKYMGATGFAGFATVLAIGLAGGASSQDLLWIPAFAGGFVSFVGLAIADRRTMPVRVSGYSHSKMTVRVWFRNEECHRLIGDDSFDAVDTDAK